MTASINPDDYSHTPKDADPREPQGFTYEDPNAQPTEPESTYVPEREFVLMPLFRRIGELLGIRRREQPEYIYEATQEAPPSLVNSVHEDANPVPESHAQPVLESRLIEASEPIHEPIQEAAKPEPEFVSEVAPVASEPITLRKTADHLASQTPSFPEPEEAEVVQTRFEEPSFANEPLPVAQSEPLEPATPAVSLQNLEQPEYEPGAEIHASQTPPSVPEVAAARSTSQAQSAERQPAPRRKDEIDEAIAILREAGSKVSTAISQAVEWLSEKEEELVREAKRSLAPAPKTRRVQPVTAIPRVTSAPPSQATQSKTEPVAAPTELVTARESSSEPTSEPLQFPGLQREISWTGNVAPARPVERSGPKAQQPIQTTYSVKPRPALVPRRPKVPFWKRIDWAAEFTPKRVAVLGGVIMAMLIVAGVTFARRPASEVLPPQPHAIQPGGVTVTTHPNPPAAAQPAQQSRQALPPAKRTVQPTTRTRASRAESFDQPDVVTHYYKQKPSPSKSATVAGVKHYSDMN